MFKQTAKEGKKLKEDLQKEKRAKEGKKNM